MYTISMNSMGHIHVWPGRRRVITTAPLNHKASDPKKIFPHGGESTLYFQRGDDIEHIRTQVMTKKDWAELEAGYPVRTKKYDWYFSEFETE